LPPANEDDANLKEMREAKERAQMERDRIALRLAAKEASQSERYKP